MTHQAELDNVPEVRRVQTFSTTSRARTARIIRSRDVLQAGSGDHPSMLTRFNLGEVEGAGGGLPTGTVTFVLGDVVGSTRLWQEHGEAMPAVLAVVRLPQRPATGSLKSRTWTLSQSKSSGRV